MSPLRLNSNCRRSLVWLLWLALLLPLAQTASFGHVLSHFGAATESDDGGASLHRLHCDLCLAGEALGGSAPPVEPPGLLLVRAVQPVPQASLVLSRAAPLALAYRSRAPPSLPV